ncbi:hypothetical protein GCM10011404_03450 [Sphingomonas prati]|nr:hypothetical protein GCM10011404_03450 [Sphingomonas prati]
MLGIIDVLELVDEQVVERLDVAAEETHAKFLVCRCRDGGRSWVRNDPDGGRFPPRIVLIALPSRPRSGLSQRGKTGICPSSSNRRGPVTEPTWMGMMRGSGASRERSQKGLA